MPRKKSEVTEIETMEAEPKKRTKKEIPQELKDFIESSPKDYEINEVNVSRFCTEAREHGIKLTPQMVLGNFRINNESDKIYLKWMIQKDYMEFPIPRLTLKGELEKLREENAKLKAAIKELKGE